MTTKIEKLNRVSDYKIAQRNTKIYFGDNTTLLISTRKNKKYMIFNPNTEKFVHFGHIDYEDYTKHKNDYRRYKYLKRASKIKGNWMNDKYSPNNLSIFILWQ